MEKKTIFSGIKPSGDLTLGNYLGAIKNWVRLQDEYNCYYCVVDLHAITVRQNPAELRRQTLEALSIYLASGLNPDAENSTIFIQSHVPAHAQCSWLLNCYTYMGELNRMTQYKDKAASGNNKSLSVGLFDYPVLMAADILLYQTEAVPVGIDQKQHVELARDIATRFNNEYSETFKVPEPFIPKFGAKIMGLQNPDKKMSKSGDNENDYILIMDDEATIRRKISKAVTDTVGKVAYNDEQPGIKNLITIICVIKEKTPEEVVDMYKDLSYKEFKEVVADTIVDELKPVREKALELLKDKKRLEEIYSLGAKKASKVAFKTLAKMHKKIGFIPPVYN